MPSSCASTASSLTELEEDWVIQEDTCVELKKSILKQHPNVNLADLAICVDCRPSSKSDDGECRFRALRRVSILGDIVIEDCDGGRYTRFERVAHEQADFMYTRPFHPRMTRESITLLQSYIAAPLLTVVKKDIALMQTYSRPTLALAKSPSYRDQCDLCSWSYGFVCWICTKCGILRCLVCSAKVSNHCGAPLTLTSSLSLLKLLELEEQLRKVPPPPPASLPQSPPFLAALDSLSRSIIVLRGTCSLNEFDEVWVHGLPFVLRTALPLQMDWSPENLASILGDDACSVENCESRVRIETTVATFFRETMVHSGADKQSIMKLKDYPTDTRFREKSPSLARDFALSLPVATCTSEDGPLNVANMFPMNYHCLPDLGPKVYAATASIQDNRHHGSTRLHMDVADAVNVMANDGKALWHIFAHEDTSGLRSYLKKRFKGPQAGKDPIHSQNIYLTPKHLMELRSRGIVPFTFEQRQGDYVFIPGGCAHQVSNMTPCVKVAADFLSPYSIARCVQVSQELRASRAASKDCLEITNLLIHAWMTLTSAIASLPNIPLSMLSSTEAPAPPGLSSPTAEGNHLLMRRSPTTSSVDLPGDLVASPLVNPSSIPDVFVSTPGSALYKGSNGDPPVTSPPPISDSSDDVGMSDIASESDTTLYRFEQERTPTPPFATNTPQSTQPDITSWMPSSTSPATFETAALDAVKDLLLQVGLSRLMTSLNGQVGTLPTSVSHPIRYTPYPSSGPPGPSSFSMFAAGSSREAYLNGRQERTCTTCRLPGSQCPGAFRKSKCFSLRPT